MMLDTPNRVGPDEAARVRLAACSTTLPSVLNALANDAAPTVRAALALNPAFVPSVDIRLMTDADVRVRTLLAGKMARLLPGMSGTDREAAQAHVNSVLVTMAGDAADHVRQVIADTLARLPDAPRALILRLANDRVLAISDPVLRFSPHLTDADLLELLATPAHPATAATVAQRHGLSTLVSDQIAAHADSAAVQALLANHSASIQEATLDGLVGRAANHPEWHGPLVARPSLPMGAIFKLARLVTGQLLDILTARSEVTPEVAAMLAASVNESLERAPGVSEDELLEGIRRMAAGGGLHEGAFMQAVAKGDSRTSAAMLAIASGVGPQIVERAIGLRSAKGLVSLVARAGFSMATAVAVQGLLGRLAPGDALMPNEHGDYPMSANEMDWQIELMEQPGR